MRTPPASPSPTREQLGIGRLFDQVADGVIIADPAARIVLWNEAAERMFGHDAASVVGASVETIIPPRFRDQHRHAFRAFVDTRQARFLGKHPVDLVALHKDGAEFPIELTLSLIELDGAPYFLALVRDLSEREAARRKLEEAHASLSRANDALEAFAYVVGHDLKEPVRAIGAYLAELRADPKGPHAADLVESAARANDQLSKLLQGLLEWSRASTLPAADQEVSVGELLTRPECAGIYEGLARERGARLEFARDLPVVVAPSVLLGQVLGNLITNAIKHNPREAPLVRVHARASPTPGRVEVLVDDDGPGMPEAVKRQFGSLSGRPATIKGGFGLAIAFRTLQRFGATARFEDAPGGGTRVVLTLATPPSPVGRV